MIYETHHNEESIDAVLQQSCHLEMLLYFVVHFCRRTFQKAASNLPTVHFGICHFLHGLIQLMKYHIANFLCYDIYIFKLFFVDRTCVVL